MACVWNMVGVQRKEGHSMDSGQRLRKEKRNAACIGFLVLASIYFAIASLHQANRKMKKDPRTGVGWEASQSPLWTPGARKKVASVKRKSNC